MHSFWKSQWTESHQVFWIVWENIDIGCHQITFTEISENVDNGITLVFPRTAKVITLHKDMTSTDLDSWCFISLLLQAEPLLPSHKHTCCHCLSFSDSNSLYIMFQQVTAFQQITLRALWLMLRWRHRTQTSLLQRTHLLSFCRWLTVWRKSSPCLWLLVVSHYQRSRGCWPGLVSSQCSMLWVKHVETCWLQRHKISFYKQ